MTDWVIFAFIMLVIALDDILRELVSSIRATFELLRDRLRSMVLEMRSLRRGTHR